MAQIAVTPILLTNVLLKLGSTDTYEKHVSAVEFAPTSSSVVWKGLGGNSVTKASLASWVCNLSFAQDWATDDSLSRFLFEHEGEDIAAVFELENGEEGFTATLSITPGSIGGAVDTIAVSSVSLGSTKPVFVPAA